MYTAYDAAVICKICGSIDSIIQSMVADPRRVTFKQFRKWTYDALKDDPSLTTGDGSSLNLVKSPSLLLLMTLVRAVIII